MHVLGRNERAELNKAVDVGEPADDLDAQRARLTQTFHSLVDSLLGAEKASACWAACAAMDQASDLGELIAHASV